MNKHWTHDLIETITFSNNDQRAVATSYRDYLASISRAQSRIVGAMLELQSEISVRDERSISVESLPSMSLGLVEGQIDANFQPMTMRTLDVQSGLTSDMQSAVWLYNEGYVSIPEFNHIVDGLANDLSLSSLLPDRILTEYGVAIDDFLKVASDNSKHITSFPTVEFIDDIDVDAILENHGLTSNTTFVTQNGDVINLKAAMLAIRDVSAINSELPVALPKLVSSTVEAITASELYNDLASSLQSTKALEIGFDILASADGLTVGASDLMSRMSLMFGEISGNVYPTLDFIASQLANSQTSVLDKIRGLSSFFGRAEEAIDLSSEGGILLDTSDDYTGASPAAAWVSGIEIDPSTIGSAVVSAVKSFGSLVCRAARWIFSKAKELGTKAVNWIHDNIVNAKDIKVVDEHSVNHAVDFPFLQFDFPLDKVPNWYYDKVDVSNLSEVFKPDGRVFEMTYSFATFRIYPYYGGNGDPTYENHRIQMVIYLAPTVVDVPPTANQSGLFSGYFPFYTTYMGSITPKEAYDNCFVKSGISLSQDVTDKEYFKSFQASIARLAMFITLLDFNVQDYQLENVDWDTPAPSRGHFVMYDMDDYGFDPLFLNPSDSDNEVNLAFRDALSNYVSDDPSNLDFAKLMRGNDIVSEYPGRFMAIIAAIANTSDDGQLAYYNDRGYWAPFISYKHTHGVVAPKYSLKSDADNAQFFSKVLLTIGAVAAVVVVGVAALKIRKALRLKVLRQEAVINARMRTLGGLPSDSASTVAITKDILKKQRKMKRTQRLLGLFGVAPTAAAASVYQFSSADSSAELSNKLNEIASHLYPTH